MTGVVFRPLVRGSTYRRGVYLLLGGVILLPYVLLGAAFAQMLGDPAVPFGATLVLLAVTAAIAAVPAFLRGTRALEIVAVRGLLDVDLPDPPPTADRETRLRTALWFAVHLAVGGVVGLGLLIALPMALFFVTQWFTGALADFRFGPLDEHDTWWLSLAGVALLIGIGYAVAGLGALAALVAPALLGPSTTERIAALESAAGQLAERNRLARELHDSVGHALTVTTLQAAAARRVLDTDPEFARRALTAIEDAGRAAMEDLDHVLGLLRDRDTVRRTPQPTLADLDRLVADAEATGLAVDATVDSRIGAVPAAVSREGYRIVQEGLTNVVRHAGRVPVALRIAISAGALDIDLSNPAPPLSAVDSAARDSAAGDSAAGTGRGLAGMRERVALLGGSLTAGRDGEMWRVRARLPTGASS